MCLAGNNLLYTMHCISMYVHLWYTCILLLVVQVILRKQSKKLTTRKAQQKNESYLYSSSNDHTVILLPGVQQNSWSQHESAVVPGYWVWVFSCQLHFLLSNTLRFYLQWYKFLGQTVTQTSVLLLARVSEMHLTSILWLSFFVF